MKADNYRVYFGLTGNTMVVCHICRKTSTKAKSSDLDRARTNLEDYKKGIA